MAKLHVDLRTDAVMNLYVSPKSTCLWGFIYCMLHILNSIGCSNKGNCLNIYLFGLVDWWIILLYYFFSLSIKVILFIILSFLLSLLARLLNISCQNVADHSLCISTTLCTYGYLMLHIDTPVWMYTHMLNPSPNGTPLFVIIIAQ